MTRPQWYSRRPSGASPAARQSPDLKRLPNAKSICFYSQIQRWHPGTRTWRREHLSGHAVNGDMRLHDAGGIAWPCWEDIPGHSSSCGVGRGDDNAGSHSQNLRDPGMGEACVPFNVSRTTWESDASPLRTRLAHVTTGHAEGRSPSAFLLFLKIGGTRGVETPHGDAGGGFRSALSAMSYEPWAISRIRLD